MRLGSAAVGAAAAVCSMVFTGAAAAAAVPAAAVARPAALGGTWGTAEKVPVLGALNAGGNAQITSVSCGSAGNCSAGGYYADRFSNTQAFVAVETDGVWGKAREVPGTAALNAGGNAQITSVSCGSAGGCSAGGWYQDGSRRGQAFVAVETNGTWGTAKEVPGTAALNAGGNAGVTSVSCASGGCSAGGQYQDGSGHLQAFVVREANGTWGTAREVPGTAALNAGGNAEITSVSCASAGGCSAGGWYEDGSGHRQAFVAVKTNGTWGTAIQIPGGAALNTGGAAQVTSVSCRSAGNCSAGGLYRDGSGHTQAFVVGEATGSWGTAIQVPGLAALNTGGNAQISQVSCGSAGHCSAAGQYTESSGHTQAFAVTETSGSWGTAIRVPGLGALNTGGAASLRSVSCAWAGHCSAGGYYEDGSGNTQAFVVGETNSTWGKAIEVPGTATLNVRGGAEITSLACTAGGHCSAGGVYADSSYNTQSFVVGK